MNITQEELKSMVNYNQETGLFTRIKNISNKTKIGQVAGGKNSKGYIVIGILGTPYYAHRLAWLYMTGETPKTIDHINGVVSDNRFKNIRDVTHQENHKNTSISKSNTSGVTGVYWVKPQNTWQASIKVNYKKIALGTFVDKNKAISARLEAEIKYGFHKNHGRDKVQNT